MIFKNLMAENNSIEQENNKQNKRYYLGNNYPSIYFTQREAECMILLIEGKTYKQIGKKLTISPRTVEFYCENMRQKLKCKTSAELVVKIQYTDFAKNVMDIRNELFNQAAR